MGPPRRLFVSIPALSSRSRFIAPQVDSVVDSLRAVLTRDQRYVLVPADSREGDPGQDAIDQRDRRVAAR